MSKSNSYLVFKIFFFLMLSLLPLTGVLAEDGSIYFKHLTVEDGLSQSAITCIMQDSRGFMWFGTHDGLNRYDGYSFKIFKHQDSDPHSLSDNYIFALTEDHNGDLWVGTKAGGLCRFNHKSENFLNFMHNPNDTNSLNCDNVTAILPDDDGFIWVGTAKSGLNLLDPKSGKFTHYQHSPDDAQSLSHDYVYFIFQDSKKRLWIGTKGGGLNLLDKTNGKFTRFVHNPENPLSLSSDTTICMLEDKKGRLWIGTGGCGLNNFDPPTGNFTRYIMKENEKVRFEYVLGLIEDSRGFLWYGTMDYGLFKFDPNNNIAIRYAYSPDNHEGLSYNSISSLYYDKSETLWIGTNGKGIDLYSPYLHKFNLIAHEVGNPASLAFSSVRSILEDENRDLWISGYGGLEHFYYKYPDYRSNQISPAFVKDIPTKFAGICIYVIHQDIFNPSVLWLGTEGGGLIKYYKKNGVTTSYKFNPTGPAPYQLNGSQIFDIYQDKNGGLWIGTENALNLFNPQHQSFKSFEHNPEDPESLSPGFVRAIFCDHNGILWIGTDEGGLSCFNQNSGKFGHFIHSDDDSSSLSYNRVYCIYEDSREDLWIGTAGGLNKFNREHKNFRKYLLKDGLPDEVIYGILEDGHGNLWLSTNKGLSKFDPLQNRFENFDKSDGLQSNEFNAGAFHKGRSGKLYFGGKNGVNAFYPDSIKNNPYIPPLAITNLQIFDNDVSIGELVNGKLILKQSITETQEIRLSHQDNFLSLEFSALNYILPKKNEYAYILEGFDPKWNYVGTHRSAHYTNLPPGEYTFRVKGSNNDDVWNDLGVSLDILILRPFWMTLWFRSLGILLGLIIILLFTWWRTRDIRMANVRLEARVQERTRELEESLANIKQLSGLLPICASCKKIRDDKGYWQQVEGYITEHSEAKFSHGICPDCMKKLYPEYGVE